MIEKQIAAILEPVADELAAINKRIDAIRLQPGEPGAPGAPGEKGETGAQGFDGRDGDRGVGIATIKQLEGEGVAIIELTDGRTVEVELPKGEKGDAGEPGAPGADGLGLETKAWEPGIYREGTFVTTAMGRIYKALADTVGEPGRDAAWQRVGSSGFAWKGLKQADAVYEDGDLYIDGGSTFVFWAGKGRMFAQRGAKGDQGAPGRDGQDGASPVHLKVDGAGFHLVMSDGAVHTAEAEGLEDYIDAKTHIKLLNWLEAQAQAIEDEGGTPIRSFNGQYIYGRSYSTGDVVVFNKALWIAKQKTRGEFVEDEWRRMLAAGAGGGGGGGGGGLVTTTSILANGILNMGTFGIAGLAPPRSGPAGALDAVNQQAMQQAIAAGSLYQGTYKPASGLPNIPRQADTSFVPPVAGDQIMKPLGAPPLTDAAKNIDVWFNLKGKGLDNFAATLAAPLQLDVTFSDGTHHSFLLPAGNYADVAAVEAALNVLSPGTQVARFHGNVNGSDFWLGVETVAPLFATSIVGQAGGGFPLFTPGPKSTVLNTYNWVVSTTDPNVPEYMPPGLPGIDAGTKVNNSDLLQFNANTGKFEIIRGGNLTQNFADQRYWQLNAGNMAWRDQPYNKGAVVYGARFNAWFVATQNIVQGSAEPGTTAAGAIWRKINSTYGSTIFFGKGDYDTAPGHQDAAHNWGMPAGTYPAGQQPLNGDSYYDVTSGTEVQFTVRQNAPIFTLTGQVGGTPADQQGAALGNADLNGWPGARAALPLPAFWSLTLGVPTTPSTGAFAGKTFPAGTYLIGFSGDPDADNGGWFMVPDVPVGPSNWTIATPHGQAQPDTITPKVVWGFRRNFSITVGMLVHADKDNVILLKHIPDTSGITHVELKHTAPDGATYEFEVIVSRGSPTLISPVAIDAHNSLFETINVGKDAANGIFVYGVTKQSGGTTINGESYLLEVTTYDYDTGVLEVGSGTELATGTPSDTVSGQYNYPGAALEKFFKDIQEGKSRPYPLKQFDIVIGATTAGVSDFIVMFYGIPNVDAATHVEIRRTDANGSTYEFDVLTVVSGTATLSPVAVKSQDSQFTKIVVGYADNTKHYYIGVVCKAKATTETYQVTVSSFDYDLDLIKPNSGATAITPALAFSTVQDSFKGDQNYPSADLTRFMKAQSGDASASLPANGVLGTATNSPQLDTTYGLKSTWDIYGDFAGKTGNALNWWEARLYKGVGGSACDLTQAIWQQMTATRVNRTTGSHENVLWPIEADFGAGYINLVNKNWSVKAGTKVFASITFDTRDTHVAIYSITVKYEATDGHMIFLQAQFTLAAGNYTQRISFYPWDSASGSSAIPVIAFKS